MSDPVDAGSCPAADPTQCDQYRDGSCGGGQSALYERCTAAAQRYDAWAFAAYLACVVQGSETLGACAGLEAVHDACKYEALKVDACVTKEAFCGIERVRRCFAEAPAPCDEAVSRFNSTYLASIDVSCYPLEPGSACSRDYGKCTGNSEW